MPKNRIHTALIGYGTIGKRHASILMENEDFDLIAVCDTNEKQLDKLPSGIKRYNNYNDLLAQEHVDLVVIATPNGYHFQQGLETITHGAHTLIEKPVCLSSDDVRTLQEHSRINHKKVFTVLQNRYSPPAAWLKEVIEKGILGKINYIQVNCFWNRDERYYFPEGTKHEWRGNQKLDGGVLYTQFSHFVDLVNWIFGEGTILHSDTFSLKQDDVELDDSGNFTFKTPTTRGQFNYSTAVYNQNLTSEITVLAEKGTVKIAGQYMNKVEVCDIENYTLPELKETYQPNMYNGFQGSANNHSKVYENVANVLLRGANQDATLEEAYQCIRLIESASQPQTRKIRVNPSTTEES